MKEAAQNLTKKQGDDLRQHVKEAVAAETGAALVVAQKLYDVFYGTTTNAKGETISLSESWGFPDQHGRAGSGFDDWVEHELHWHMSKARSYIRVWDELFTRRSLDPATLPDSMQQLRMIAKIAARVDDVRELKQWVTKSKQLSCCEFEAEVEEHFGFGKGKRKTMSFAIPLNFIKRSQSTIQRARTQYGASTTGEALVKILQDWNEAHAKAEGARRQAG